jgi:hypothetical protein
MFDKFFEKRKLEALKEQFKNFSNLIASNPNLNISTDEYNNTHGPIKDLLDHILFINIYGTYFETFCLELSCQLVFIVTKKQELENISSEIMEYLHSCLPVNISVEMIIKYYNNGWGAEGRDSKFPVMFQSIALSTNLVIINNDNTTLVETATELFEHLISYYLNKYELKDKDIILAQYIDTIKNCSRVVKKGIEIYNQCFIIATRASDTLLADKSLGMRAFETMNSNGDVDTLFEDSFIQVVQRDILNDLSNFCMYVLREKVIEKSQTKYEKLFLSSANIHFFDSEKFFNKYLKDFTSILPDSFFTMLQVEDYYKKEYATWCDDLLNIYKNTIMTFQSFGENDINAQNRRIEEYFSMIKSKLGDFRNKKTIDRKLVEKFDSYCDFVDNLVNIGTIINIIRKSQKLKSIEINYTMGYQIENDFLSFLFFLTSYQNQIQNISLTSANILNSLFGKIDIQQELIKFTENYSDDFEKQIPISFMVLLFCDNENDSEIHYSEILYNLFKDIGDEYLQCIGRYSYTEYNSYHRYMNRIYNYLKKNLKKVTVMQITQGHYSQKSLDFNPDLLTKVYNDYEVIILSDDIVLHLPREIEGIEDEDDADACYDDDGYFDDDDDY